MQYRKDIDGLRAVAVLPVILFHAGIEVFSGGYIGVDVFFVISGFLITTILMAELETGNFSIKRFYERRARRILPALAAIVLFCIPLAYYFMSPNEMKSFARSVFAVGVFASNVLFYKESGYFAAAAEEKPLLHTWSLAIEEQYYILFPIFLWLVWRYRRHWLFGTMVVVTAISFALCQYFINRHPEATFYLLPTRAWELFVGSILAYLMRYKTFFTKATPQVSQKASLLGLLMVVVPIFTFDKTTPFPSAYALLPVLGTALIIAYSHPQTLVYKFLSLWPLVGIGLISYSAYLWHQPFFAFLRLEMLGNPNPVHMYVAAAASIVVAYFSWRYIEQPFRHKQRFNQKRIFKYSAVTLVAMLAFGFAGSKTDGFMFMQPEGIQKIQRHAQNLQHTVRKCPDQRGPFCIIGDESQKPDIIIIGDSHAEALAVGLDKVLNERKLSAVAAIQGGCAPILNVIRLRKGSEFQRCIEYNKRLKAYLQNNQFKYGILLYRYPLYITSKRFDNGIGGKESGEELVLVDTISKRVLASDEIKNKILDTHTFLTSHINNLVTLGAVPEMGWHVPQKLIADFKKDRGINADIPYKAYSERSGDINKFLSSLPKSTFYPVDEFFCNNLRKGYCSAQNNNGMPLYFDDDHPSPAAAKEISRNILRTIKNNWR